MIFVTTGTQEPFDRLIKAVDDIAAELTNTPVIAQSLDAKYIPRNVETRSFINPREYDKLFREAKFIVAHAGMGTIISALTLGKPLIVMPRVARLGEHRNEHQMATAKKMEALGYVYIAYNDQDLRSKVFELLEQEEVKPLHYLGNWASQDLIGSLRKFIFS